MTNTTQPRRCYAILESQFVPGKGFVPSLVTEGEADHSPMIGSGEQSQPWFWGVTLEVAQATCDRVNLEDFNLSPDEAKEIVDSSITESIIADARRQRFEEDLARKLGQGSGLLR